MDDENESDYPLSEDEEEYLDLLLNNQLEEENGREYDFVPVLSSQGSCEDGSQSTVSTSASQDPLATSLYWKDDKDFDDGMKDPRTFSFKPEKAPGLQFGFLTRQSLKAFKKPVDFLYLFLTHQIVLQICIATNHHAEQLIAKGQNLSYSDSDGGWNQVTVAEMYRFFGIVIYMSIVNLPNLEKYWSRSPLYDASVVDKVMPIIRFKALLSFLQINCDPDKDDKLTRIGLLLDHVQNVSQSMYHPYEAVSVDERMVSSKHQYSGIRQFIRDKPIRFGIKLWVLADALSGYTYAFYVYLGKKRTVICQKSKGLAYNVVMELGKNIFQQGYRIYTDSFYTTQHLADDLLTKRTFLIGAVRRTSSAMPKQFKDIEQFEKCSARGDFRWHRANCFAYVQWRDCKTVTVISPIHRGSDVSYCHRTVNERKGFKKKKVVQPSVIHDYNTNMGGVDKSNQMLNKYPCYIKSKFHWWKVIFFHCIDIMIVNSFIILTEFNQKTSNKVENISNQLEYREALALSLMDIHSSDETEKQTCMPACLDKRIDCSYCNAKASLKGNKTPSTKTNIYCSKCEVPLCLRKDRNCFTKWHSVGGEEAKQWVKERGRKRSFINLH
ncbi:Hypothetical predicted protein [Mytilus galloprovincialis]|uniref:PiggyBac transposable element-derived protein domain-containing protein n=1 Tax=Mytilus galloprovincialis TaxID=29158 RepID=A0A8B6DXW8_MYTGA|nr:Hypothetical predicted protein [Mytilus galloprovincialis]VDI60418.1 Hypothetical predicted protein [Mytilus galloprovincialis]